MRTNARKALSAAIAAVLATLGGAAYAAIPDGNTIHGCYKEDYGQLRVIEVSGDCGPSELAISWNQQGPPGLPGRDGEDGRDGVDGVDGADGRDGVDGEDGVDGRDGAAGPSTATFGTAQGSILGGFPEGERRWVGAVSKTVPAGSWAVTATVNTTARNYLLEGPPPAETNRDLLCELRSIDQGEPPRFIGGAADRRVLPSGETAKTSLSMNGGAQVPAGGAEVGVWCWSSVLPGREVVDHAQIMLVQVGGFS